MTCKERSVDGEEFFALAGRIGRPDALAVAYAVY
jgi:hypothetical protein